MKLCLVATPLDRYFLQLCHLFTTAKTGHNWPLFAQDLSVAKRLQFLQGIQAQNWHRKRCLKKICYSEKSERFTTKLCRGGAGEKARGGGGGRKQGNKRRRRRRRRRVLLFTSFAGAHSSSLHSSGAFTALILGSSATFCNKNLLDCCCNEGTKAVVPRELR